MNSTNFKKTTNIKTQPPRQKQTCRHENHQKQDQLATTIQATLTREKGESEEERKLKEKHKHKRENRETILNSIILEKEEEIRTNNLRINDSE